MVACLTWSAVTFIGQSPRSSGSCRYTLVLVLSGVDNFYLECAHVTDDVGVVAGFFISHGAADDCVSSCSEQEDECVPY